MKASHTVKVLCVLLALSLCLFSAGCGGSAPSPLESAPAASAPVATAPESAGLGLEHPAVDEMFTKRDFDPTYTGCTEISLADGASTASTASVQIEGDRLTVTHDGVYRLEGSLGKGQIVVQAPDTAKVQLVLAGVSLSNEGSAAINIVSADKVFITAAKDSENYLCSTGAFVNEDGEKIDAAVYAQTDICFNGEGRLVIDCESGHGIATKDDLKICAGSYVITSAKQGLSGKDSIRIGGGDIVIESGGDALHSEHSKADKGYVFISGGSISARCGKDGVDCTNGFEMLAGTLDITAKGGAESALSHEGSSFEEEQHDSCKGIKSASDISLSGGTVNINAADDALHAAGDISLSGAVLSLKSGDDGIHADGSVTISGGRCEISESYEGIEGSTVSVSGGNVRIVSYDDGINTAGGADASGFGGWMGGDRFGADSDCVVDISGGEIVIKAGGDGIDSNGSIIVSGDCVVYISASPNDGNSALDYGIGAEISGGIVAAASADGMAVNFSAAPAQGSILCVFSRTHSAGEPVVLSENGKELLSFVPEYDYQAVVLSCAGVSADGQYSVSAGDESLEIIMEGSLYGGSFGPGGFGHGGPGAPGAFRPGVPGEMPPDRPEDFEQGAPGGMPPAPPA